MARKPRGPAQASTVRMLGAGHAVRVETGKQIRTTLSEALSVDSDAPEPALDVGGRGGALAFVYDAMSETEFERHVEEALTARGYLWWHVPDSRRMNPGLPDIIALGPMHGRGPIRLLFFELKRQKGGRRRPKQREVIAYLQQVATVDARFVTPADWQAITDALDAVAESEDGGWTA